MYSPSVFVNFRRLGKACSREWKHNKANMNIYCDQTNSSSRSRWPRGLRRRSATAWLLGSRLRIPMRAWMFLLCLYEYVVLSCVGRGHCDGMITRPEDSYRVYNCVWLRNLIQRTRFNVGCSAIGKPTVAGQHSHRWTQYLAFVALMSARYVNRLLWSQQNRFASFVSTKYPTVVYFADRCGYLLFNGTDLKL
jgi:hypothetical protein